MIAVWRGGGDVPPGAPAAPGPEELQGSSFPVIPLLLILGVAGALIAGKLRADGRKKKAVPGRAKRKPAKGKTKKARRRSRYRKAS